MRTTTCLLVWLPWYLTLVHCQTTEISYDYPYAYDNFVLQSASVISVGPDYTAYLSTNEILSTTVILSLGPSTYEVHASDIRVITTGCTKHDTYDICHRQRYGQTMDSWWYGSSYLENTMTVTAGVEKILNAAPPASSESTPAPSRTSVSGSLPKPTSNTISEFSRASSHVPTQSLWNPLATSGTMTTSQSVFPAASTPKPSSNEISSGSKAGIGVGVAFGIVGATGVIGCLLIRRRRRRLQEEPLEQTQPNEWESTQPRFDREMRERRFHALKRVKSDARPAELESGATGPQELSGSDRVELASGTIHELDPQDREAPEHRDPDLPRQQEYRQAEDHFGLDTTSSSRQD